MRVTSGSKCTGSQQSELHTSEIVGSATADRQAPAGVVVPPQRRCLKTKRMTDLKRPRVSPQLPVMILTAPMATASFGDADGAFGYCARSRSVHACLVPTSPRQARLLARAASENLKEYLPV